MEILNVKVSNMNGRSGRPVPNQFIIETLEGWYFQSYDSVIAFRSRSGKVTLDTSRWDYSRTTGKYRNAFLGEMTHKTQKKIDSGEYLLANLN